MARNRLKSKGRSESGRFLALPHIVLNNEDYINLSYKSKALLIDLAMQYNGKNNGNFSAALGVMRKRGWTRSATLSAATKELVEANLIIRTREGKFLNPGAKCALYAITWEPIDDCFEKDLEVRATIKAPRLFSKTRLNKADNLS